MNSENVHTVFKVTLELAFFYIPIAAIAFSYRVIICNNDEFRLL